jgi:hypothetical protein
MFPQYVCYLNSYQCLMDHPSVPTHPEQGSPEADCTPWIAATHPDGALYFYHEDRVSALATL